MTIAVEMRTTPFGAKPTLFNTLSSGLTARGYSPLIVQAKERYLDVFGVGEQVDSVNPTANLEQFENDPFRYLVRSRYIGRYREDNNIPVAGDLYFTDNGKGLLYAALMVSPRLVERNPQEAAANLSLELGYVGEETAVEELEAFAAATEDILSETEVVLEWQSARPASEQFRELSQNEETRFMPAVELSEDDLQLASYLDDASTRNLALLVKRSGGILASDLMQRAGTDTEGTKSVIGYLTSAELLAQQYVVICRRTSNQVNRVASKRDIDEMSNLGILCACGKPISSERVEELYSPTPGLQRMLDSSYWMSANLVQTLTNLNVERDHILLNLLEGAEEIDAFIDLDGTLVMVELKDSEFSMGHAYPFSGRIGLFKPDYAVIVSTVGVAPEVKAYFERVEPEAEIVYVDTLDTLASSFQDMMQHIRSERGLRILSSFDSLASFDMPLSRLLGQRLGVAPTGSRPIVLNPLF